MYEPGHTGAAHPPSADIDDNALQAQMLSLQTLNIDNFVRWFSRMYSADWRWAIHGPRLLIVVDRVDHAWHWLQCRQSAATNTESTTRITKGATELLLVTLPNVYWLPAECAQRICRYLDYQEGDFEVFLFSPLGRRCNDRCGIGKGWVDSSSPNLVPSVQRWFVRPCELTLLTNFGL